MFLRIDKLQIELPLPKEPEPNAAAALQELLGGKYGDHQDGYAHVGPRRSACCRACHAGACPVLGSVRAASAAVECHSPRKPRCTHPPLSRSALPVSPPLAQVTQLRGGSWWVMGRDPFVTSSRLPSVEPKSEDPHAKRFALQPSSAIRDFSQSFSLRASTLKSVVAAQSLRPCRDHV
jgi:hypothetical protein